MTESVALVVDDSAVNRMLLARHLASMGISAREATDGRSALAELQASSGEVAVVLLDVMMPEMDGYETLAAIKADEAFRHMPVIMISGVDELDSVARCIEMGAADFLPKPFNPVILAARVRAALADKHLHDIEAAHAAEQAELLSTIERQKAELSRFLSPQVAALVSTPEGEQLLAGHRREATAVFADLRGFTAFSDTAEPEEVLRVLREYHAAMGTLIVAHGGTLEHFAGDGMMVFFNDPVLQPDHAERAVRMALGMRAEFERLAARWSRLGYDLGLGIGIATGYATLGRIGFEGRYDYGMIGTAVIVASRLSSAAEADQVLINPRTHAAVEELVAGRAGRRAAAERLQPPDPDRERPLRHRRPGSGSRDRVGDRLVGGLGLWLRPNAGSAIGRLWIGAGPRIGGRHLRIVVRRGAGPMVPCDPHNADDDQHDAHDLRSRNAAHGPVPALAEGLEHEARRAVPDRPERGQVTGLQAMQIATRQEQDDEAAEDVECRLVEEERVEAGRLDREERAWVGGDAVGAVDRDTPRQVGWWSVQLLVEEVAPAGDALGEERAGDNGVEPESERKALPAGVDDDAQCRTGHAAIQPETRVGRQDDRQQVVLVQRPLIDHVVQAAAEQREHQHQRQRTEDVRWVDAAPLRLALRDEQHDRQADDIAQAVPADGYARDHVRTRGDVDHGEHGRSIPILGP